MARQEGSAHLPCIHPPLASLLTSSPQLTGSLPARNLMPLRLPAKLNTLLAPPSTLCARSMQDDVEKEELRVELALSEKARRKRLEELSHASLEVNNGIDAFEINMKRLIKVGITLKRRCFGGWESACLL